MLVVYFSSGSGMTKKFVDKLPYESVQISAGNPLSYAPTEKFILVVPTYHDGSSGRSTVHPAIRKFLSREETRDLLVGIIGTGNTNFGEHFCIAAREVAYKTGKPLIQKVELSGLPEDVEDAISNISAYSTS